MHSSEVTQSSNVLGSLSVTAMFDFWGEANTSIHGLGEDDTAIKSEAGADPGSVERGGRGAGSVGSPP